MRAPLRPGFAGTTRLRPSGVVSARRRQNNVPSGGPCARLGADRVEADVPSSLLATTRSPPTRPACRSSPSVRCLRHRGDFGLPSSATATRSGFGKLLVSSRCFPSGRTWSAPIRSASAARDRAVAPSRLGRADLYARRRRAARALSRRAAASRSATSARQRRPRRASPARWRSPPSARSDLWMQRLPRYARRVRLRWLGCGRGRVSGHVAASLLSDHADWDGLTATIAATGRKKSGHPCQEDALVPWCGTRGLKAPPLDIVGYRDEDEDLPTPDPSPPAGRGKNEPLCRAFGPSRLRTGAQQQAPPITDYFPLHLRSRARLGMRRA